MSYSTSRLTLFAVLSAIEGDLREKILFYLEDRKSLEDLVNNDLISRLKERLEKDIGVVEAHLSLKNLLPYIDFGDSFAILNSNSNIVAPHIAKYLREITPQLEKLVPVRNRVMHSRPLHFDDLAVTLDVAEELVKNNDFNWKNLRETLLHLERDPSFVLNLEIPTYFSLETGKKHNLPIPDFDETGFLGRKQQVSELIKRCLGPYPVISVLGDGGIGKTALALKVAYDILDMPESPFEAIVWTSSKTSQLTPQEIVKIEGAICDSIGVFQNVADQLVGTQIADPLQEVLDYLREFRILLIIDNLETVLDERIRSFLERLPMGSKVLITSRIGLGAFEYPIKLQSMDQREAVELLRAMAKIRGVNDLARMDNAKLAGYSQRMKHSPGFIKWFVSAVQTGKRPEEVLSKPDVFLDFCMSNVYNYLSEKGRQVLRSMLCLPGKHSQAELAFLNDMEAIDLQPAIHELLRTNMVIMSSISKGSSFESQYEVSDLARNYLSRHHPPEPKEFDKMTRRKRQLVAAGEEIRAEKGTDPYSFYSLTMRSRSDLIVAKYLIDALRQAEARRYTVAEELITKARNLAPEYFEVHRVDALIKTQQGNHSAAHLAYEAAIELEPKSAPLRKWYGSFLLRYMEDMDGAAAQFNEAATIDPTSNEIQLEIARVALFRRDFDQSLAIIEKIRIKSDVPARMRRKIYDIYLQCFYRRADYLLSQKDYIGAIVNIGKLKEAYQTCPPTLLDDRMREKLANSLPVIRSCIQVVSDEQFKSMAATLHSWITEQIYRTPDVSTVERAGDRIQGVVTRLPVHKSYGFILANDRREYFLHRSELVNPEEWHLITVGTRLTFIEGSDTRGPKALRVVLDKGANTATLMPIVQPPPANAVQRFAGRIVRLPLGESYGFLSTEDGERYFFHSSQVRGPHEWHQLRIGQRLTFSIGRTNKGPCAVDVVTEDVIDALGK